MSQNERQWVMVVGHADKDNTIDMPRYLKQQLKSVKSEHGDEEGYGTHRLLFDEFSQVVYSSKGSLHAKVQRLIHDKQFTMEQAIERVAVMLQQGAFR